MALAEKRQRFANEYIVDLNATQAAIRAGYSEATAYSQGQRLLKDAEVRAVIDDLMAKRSAKTEITQEFVLKSLLEIATKSAADGEGYSPAAANRALELIGKHIGMFKDVSKVDHHVLFGWLKDKDA